MESPIIKTIILALTIITILTSCQEATLTRDEIVKRNVEEYLMERLNDPESYEFVELQNLDSVIFKANIEHIKNRFQIRMQYEQKQLEGQLEYKNDPILRRSLYREEWENGHSLEIDRYKKLQLAIDSIEIALGDTVNHVASYTYYFSCRAKNAFGAKILSEYILQTTPAPEYEVLNLVNENDKVYLTPNAFPGYYEIMEKSLR